MRRCYLNGVVLLSLSGMTGCSIIPSFPDLWPFNDDPAANSSPSQSQAQLPDVDSLQQSAPAPAPIPAPAVPTETALLVPQPAPVPGNSGGVTSSVPGAVAYIISPADGAVVTNPVRVLFGLDRMGIAPITSNHEGTGHHHLLINAPPPSLDRAIPVDENHRHFSGGQTETTLNLPVGEHTLQLLLGDNTHTPHRPPVLSQQITITVQ